MRILAAAACYFAIVFGIGFLLGPFRVLLLEPRLGETWATLCEAPVLLVAIVIAARWLPPRFDLRTAPQLVAMGLAALVLQQAADFGLGGLLRGITPAQQFAHVATPAGAIYAALVIAFAAMPLLVTRNRR
jgi:hypothetical protein